MADTDVCDWCCGSLESELFTIYFARIRNAICNGAAWLLVFALIGCCGRPGAER